MYYLSDISKTEIGHHLGISRFRVSRLLEQAREEGIVQIQINEPIATNTDIEEKLEKRFNLHLAIVVNPGDSTDTGDSESSRFSSSGLSKESFTRWGCIRDYLGGNG